VIVAWIVLLTGLAQLQDQPAPSSAAEESLQRFVREYVRDYEKGTRYFRAFVDLDGHGRNAVIVYLVGPDWCGTGGCPTLVLVPEASSYRLVGEISISRPPIRVLAKTSEGWRNLAVWVEGGGIRPGYEAELRFHGKRYPSNPSMPPARRLAGKVAGEIAIAAAPIETGKPLD
jgi:hypothetical protein